MYTNNSIYFGESDPTAPKKGGFGKWLGNLGKGLGDFVGSGKADDALGTVNHVLCTINPNRPGCVPQAPIYVAPQKSPLVAIAVVVLIALVIFLILKKKK